MSMQSVSKLIDPGTPMKNQNQHYNTYMSNLPAQLSKKHLKLNSISKESFPQFTVHTGQSFKSQSPTEIRKNYQIS